MRNERHLLAQCLDRRAPRISSPELWPELIGRTSGYLVTEATLLSPRSRLAALDRKGANRKKRTTRANETRPISRFK
jgi:hypothetical protein